jgi:hypothetical protein
MKIVLAILAIGGFCLEGLSSLYGLIQFWPEESDQGVIEHIGHFAGYFAGSVAGVFVAIACCLPAKQPKIMPPPVQPPITGK